MKKLFLFACAALTSLAMSATQYCQTNLTSNDGTATIQLSCEKVGVTYQITIEGTNLNGLGGSFFNPGATDLRTAITTSTATKIVCVISTSEAPSLYTPLYVLMPGEKVFNWPNDIEWGSCGGGVEDTVAPVLTSASLVSNTHNQAVIAVAATDNIGVVYYEVMNGETLLGNLAATEGQITVKGLTPATAYALAMKAVDAAGNKSAAQTVSFTTDSFSYCDAPVGHLGNANFGDPEGRILLTLAKKDDNGVIIIVKPNYANGATKKLDFLYVAPQVGAPVTAGADVETGGEDELSVELSFDGGIPDNFNLAIEWSQPAWGGRWHLDLNGISKAELCTSTPTALEQTIETTRSQKILRNGHLYILHNGNTYTILGQ